MQPMGDMTTVDRATEGPNDIFTCHDCGAKACVPCDRPWHDGEACLEYRLRVKDRVDEEDKLLKTIGKISKPCPRCKRSIQKNGGCTSMICQLPYMFEL